MTASWPSLTPPYNVIAADPPWTYAFTTRTSEVPGTGWRGGVENHYPGMTMDEIRALPVGDLASQNAVLWLWVVNAMLPACLDVVGAWGFEYRSVLTWAKTTREGAPFTGMGYWMRGATEHCILAVRGKPRPLRRDVPTWFAAPPGAHSRKPDEAARIFETYTVGPRVELFARGRRAGWDAWGLEADAPLAPAAPGQDALFGGVA